MYKLCEINQAFNEAICQYPPTNNDFEIIEEAFIRIYVENTGGGYLLLNEAADLKSQFKLTWNKKGY